MSKISPRPKQQDRKIYYLEYLQEQKEKNDVDEWWYNTVLSMRSLFGLDKEARKKLHINKNI